MIKSDLFNTHRATSPHSTQWLWMYVRVTMILILIFSVVTCSNSIKALLYYGSYDFSLKAVYMGYEALPFLIIPLILWTYFELNRFSKRSFVLNRILLISEVIILLVRYGFNIELGIFNFTEAMVGLITAIAWAIPNWLYFNRREALFNSPKI